MAKATITKRTTICIVFVILINIAMISVINGNGIPPDSDNKPSITIDIARQVALTKLDELHKTDFSIKDSLKIDNEQQEPLFYVFSLRPQGYLVVTGSYDLPPVIAYSVSTSYDDTTNTNPLYELLYADVTLRLKNRHLIPKHVIDERHNQWESYINGDTSTSSRFEQWPPEGTTPTGGWLLTNWNQNAPYNNFCPLDIVNGGSRSYAGCPAVAMALILNYYNTTYNIAFHDGDDYYHNYAGNKYWIDNDYITYGFKSFPQLNSYLSTLESHYENNIPPTNDDKAALTFACGVACKQVYSASGSGTFGVNQAYNAYLRFNCNTISLLNGNHPALYQILSNNMKIALPAHLAVVNPQWTAGHNLVVDGYNTNDYYHLNFGWGGSYNGWYLIPNELPYSLTVIEGVIVNITGVPELSSYGTLEWVNAIPNEIVTASFTVRNIGQSGSNLDWRVIEWPSWGTWTFTPAFGNNIRPIQGPISVTASVLAPNIEDHLFTGFVKVVNIRNTSDYDTIAVSLKTGNKTDEKIFCNGSLNWGNVKPLHTIKGSFTIQNIGAALSNLSWEISEWPEWGIWSFDIMEGDDLTPEDGPVTINVSVIAPLKRNSQFTGNITIINSENSSDYDTVPILLATPYSFNLPFRGILQALMERFPHIFPLLRYVLF